MKTRTIKKVIMQLMSVIMVCQLSAQRDEVVRGQEYREGGHFEMITEREGSVFVSRTDTDLPYYVLGGKMQIWQIDPSSMMATKVVDLEGIEDHDYQSIKTIDTGEGLAHIYMHRTKDNQLLYSAQLFDYDQLTKRDIVDLARFDILVSGDRDSELGTPIWKGAWPQNVLLSEDKTKMAVYSYQERIGKENNTLFQYAVIDLTSQMTVMHQDEYITDKESRHYRLVDLHLSNDGSLYYVEKSYKKDRSRDWEGRKPSYIYSIIKLSRDSTDYIYDINPRQGFMSDVVVGTGTNGHVYAASYLQKKPDEDHTGYFFLELDANGYKVAETRQEYTPRQIESITGKEDKALHSEYQVVDLLVRDDVIYVLKEHRERNTRSQMFNNTGGFINNRAMMHVVTHYYERMVVEAMDHSTATLRWIATNPREHYAQSDYLNPFLVPSYFVTDNHLHFVYNERPSNLVKMKSGEKISDTNLPGSKVVTTIASINKEGRVDYQWMDDEGRWYIPDGGVLVGDEYMYFLRSRDFDRVRFAKLPLSRIQSW